MEHISVCICTYRRPILLKRLLSKLLEQQTEDLFTYSVVVVDNDYNQSAKIVVECLTEHSKIHIDYQVEPKQNIALARNKAVDCAYGNYIAFIDDDEFPDTSWLLNLYRTLSLSADGVLGPVKPHFDDDPPHWLIKAKFCERESHKTGSILSAKHTRTGNALLLMNIFEDKNNRFNPEFGRTGGEDIEFFYKLINEGKVFIWCEEAPVYEVVQPERWEKSFYIKKYLRMGGLTGEKYRTRLKGGFRYLFKVCLAFFLYLFFLPLSFLIGKHIYMKCITKVCYYIGCITGFLGHVIIRYREEQK